MKTAHGWIVTGSQLYKWITEYVLKNNYYNMCLEKNTSLTNKLVCHQWFSNRDNRYFLLYSLIRPLFTPKYDYNSYVYTIDLPDKTSAEYNDAYHKKIQVLIAGESGSITENSYLYEAECNAESKILYELLDDLWDILTNKK